MNDFDDYGGSIANDDFYKKEAFYAKQSRTERPKIKKERLNDIADAVIKKLRGKVIIHRYDAYSTNSIYLKFDYGVAYSLRISDHDGKQHLKYRFNILESMGDRSSKKECYRDGCKMIFYSPAMVNACCRDILAAKAEKVQQYQNYGAAVAAAMEKTAGQRGFWTGARLVSTWEDDHETD